MIPNPLKQGIKSLEEVEKVDIQNRFWKDGGDSKLVLHMSIEHGVESAEARLPVRTVWYLLVDADYPSGDIKIYPSSKDGIERTFAHQMQNRKGGDSPWRTGNICVGRYESISGRSGDREPLSPEKRLQWYLERAVKWVEDAAKGELRKEGDFYEVPDFNSSRNSPKFVFCETYESFEKWKSHKDSWGKAITTKLDHPTNRILTRSFIDQDDEEFHHPDWGDYVSGRTGEDIISGWILLQDPPFQEPWTAPETWDDLDSFLNGIPSGIYRLVATINDDLPETEDRYLLVGFPIPEKIGEEPSLIHWQPLLIPHIPSPAERDGGFREGLSENWHRETKKSLKSKDVRWLASENWAGEQLSRRGKVSKNLAGSKILLLGVGALGSVVAENLIRAGIRDLTIIDEEIFEVGNVARHTLTLDDIGKHKATAATERLRSLSPQAEITGINSNFPPGFDYRDQLQDADLVIDCTGENSVIEHLQGYPWLDSVRFCSVSMGRRGNRLFVFQAYDNIFPRDQFHSRIQKWLQKEDLERTENDIIAERVGCWHPASVVSMDKVAAWGGIVPELLEDLMDFKRNESEFSVFERENKEIVEVGEPFIDSSIWKGVETGRELQILRDCSLKMIELCADSPKAETGGILVGKYTEDDSRVLVAIADEPAPDSVQGATTLCRGSEGVNEWLEEQRRLKQVEYLGEWHYHPSGRPDPSEIDKETSRGIADNDDYACSEPIMIIVGGDTNSGFSRGVYAFDEKEGIEKFEKVN